MRLGETLIMPASREVRGPGGETTIEPRVMQVLLALADAAGAVVTRDDLIRLCWDQQFVGDDALNRAIAEVRRLARTVGADAFTIETIPRTGYRLTGATVQAAAAQAPGDAPPVARRVLLGVAGLGLAAAGAGAWALWPDGKARRAADLATQAQLAMVDEMPAGAARGVDLLRAATALRPTDARLWGRLALALRAASEGAAPDRTAAAVQACEAAAARALALDPAQPDAQVALILLRSSYGDWLVAERALRDILRREPGQVDARSALAVLLQAVGRSRDSSEIVTRLSTDVPLSPVFQYRRTYDLWMLGRVGEADRTIDRAIELWPRHPGVWFARLWLSGFTGRAAAAVAQVDDIDARPPMGEAQAALLRLSMQALQSRAPATVQAAAKAVVESAMSGPGASVNAILILSALGRLDEAFAVADGYLLRQGPHIMPLRYTRAQTWVNDQRHRKTMMLFVPATAPMRVDPRFIDLCRGAGFVDYWRQSGQWPDFLGARRIS
jgi:DNA-binding winged helix-turn-helix (wHTH) protein